MKILFITNKLPYAEVVGGHRIIYYRIRYLAEQGHDVGLLTFVKNETDQQIQSLKPLLKEFCIIPHPQRNIFIRIFHDYICLARPAVFWKNYSKAMLKKVGEISEKGNYDVILAEFSEMGLYLYKNPYLSAINTIVSCHRCVTASYEKYALLGEIKLRFYLKSILQLHGLQKYEFNMYRNMDRVFVLTPQDRFTLQYYAQDLSVSVVSSGVDIKNLQELPALPKEPIILHTGYMGDPANEDSVLWFFKHVWVKVRERYPETQFYIVGAGASSRIRRLAKKDSRIIVTRAVQDIRPYRSRAKVFVAPVRLGSGVRTKVLEAMASGLPVVSSSLGMEGIEAQTGVNCLIADTPELFIQSVEWLLTDGAVAKQIANNARELVEKKHSLDHDLDRFEKMVQSVVYE